MNSAVPSRRGALRHAVSSVIESLEERRLFADTPSQIGISFQPWASEASTGYLTDAGEAYGTQQFGYDYGWDTAVGAGNLYQRDASKSQKLETGVITSTSNDWEISLPNGTYVVKLVAGDANVTSGTYKYNVEGTTNFINGTAGSGNARWVSASGEVAVSDGKLTIHDNGGTQHRLAYVEITRKDVKNSTDATAAPSGITATARLSTWVDLRWVDNAAENFEDGYEIQRSKIVNNAPTETTTIFQDGGITQLYIDWTREANTTYSYKVRALRTTTTGVAKTSAWSDTVTVTTPANDNQGVYGPSNWAVPGVIQAEAFDKGAGSAAYGDSTAANAGGFYRGGSIDIGLNGPTNAYFVGWVDTNDWQEYTVNIPVAGTYYIDALVASKGAGGTWKVQQNGTDKKTGIQVYDTGSWGTYALQSTGTFSLTSGSSEVLRFWATSKDSSGKFVGNFDSFALRRFDAPSGLTTTPVSSSQMNLSWTSNATTPDAFLIERKLGSGGTWAPLATVSGSVTTYSDTDPALQGSQTYHYRVRAQREIKGVTPLTTENTGYSNESGATLPAPAQVPAAPTGLNASVNGPAVTLTWVDASNNETGFYILRKLASANWPADPITPYATLSAVNQTSYIDNSTAAGESYHYKVVAYNSVGRSTASNQVSAVVPSSLVTTLTPVEDTHVRDAGYAGINYGNQLTVEAKSGSGYTRQAFLKVNIASLSGTVNDATLRVYGRLNTANDGSGGIQIIATEVANSSWSESTMTWNNKPTIGSVIDQISVTGTSYAWHEFDLTAYVAAAVANSQSTITIGLTGITSTSAYLGFVSTEDVSQPSKWPQLVVTHTAISSVPNPPTGLQRVSPPDNGVAIAWTDNATNETGFEIERKTGSGTWTLLSTNSANDIDFVDAAYVATSDQSYRVRAVNGSTSSAYGNEIVVPAKSDAPTVSALSPTSLTLAWNDASLVENNVRVERRIASGTWNTLATLAANATTYTDTTVADGTVYEYRIRAITASADGLPSAATQAVVPLKAPTGLVTTSVQSISPAAVNVSLSWTDISANNSHYEVQRQLVGGTWSPLTTAVTGYAYTDTTAQPDKTYEYRVRAINGTASANSSFVTLTPVVTPPATPTTFAVDSTTVSSVTLSWADTSTTETAYRVERRETAIGGDYTTITPDLAANSTTFTDTGRTEGTQYDYRVRAIGVAGDGWAAGPAQDWTKLHTPTDAAAVTASATAVNVTWTDASAKETGYEVQYSTSNAFPVGASTGTATAAANSTSKLVAGLTAGTTYYFRVRAVHTNTASQYANTTTATTTGTLSISRSPSGNPNEGTQITLTPEYVSGSAISGTTYAWTVLKNNVTFATGSGATFNFTPDDNGSYTASVVATTPSGQTDSGLLASPITVGNVAPTATITGVPSAGNEGTAITVGSTVTDPGSADTLTYGWTVYRNSEPFTLPGGTITNGTGFTFTPTDNGSYVIRLTVGDDDAGNTTVNSSAITVSNVAPNASITGAPTGSISSGTTVNLTAVPADAGSEDTFTYEWSVTRNGSPFALPGGTVVNAAAFTFIPTLSGSYVAAVTVTDDDGGFLTVTQSISATSQAPVAAVSGPATGSEGTSLNYTVSATGNGTLSYLWSVTKDGQPFVLPGATTVDEASFAFIPPDNGNYVVTCQVGDVEGTVTPNKSTMVSNAAPSVAITGVPATGTEGTAITVGSAVTDPGSADTLIYAWTVYRNNELFILPGGTTTNGTGFTFTPTDNGSYVIRLTVVDDDAGSTTVNSSAVAVANTAPVLTATGPTTAVVGGDYTLILSATDAGAADVITWTIDWGDGTVTQPQGRAIAPTHQYGLIDEYTITISASDGTVSASPSPATITVDVVEGSEEPELPDPPQAPTGATVSLVAPTEALIDWTASTGDPDEYFIYASINGGDYELYDFVGASHTSYRFFVTDTVSVSFKVSASNEGGESAKTDVLAAGGGSSTVSVSGSTPAVPTGLGTAGVSSIDSVELTWTATADATGYVVEWSNGDGEWIAITDVDGTSYSDEYPILGTQQYRVRAYRRQVGSEYSDPTAALPVHPVASPVAWHDNNGGANAQETLSTFQTKHGQPLTFSVVPNDIDYDGTVANGNLVIEGFSQPEHGTITLNATTGAFTYTPEDAEYVGTDTFTYWVTDGQASSAPATVAIDVTNVLPIAANQSRGYSWEDFYRVVNVGGTVVHNALHINLTGTDADADVLAFSIESEPTNGTLVSDGTASGYWYSPSSSFMGSDSFSYEANDGVGNSYPATVRIVNTLPVAVRHDEGFWAYDVEPQYDSAYPVLSSPNFEPTILQISQGQKGDIIFGGWESGDPFLEATGHITYSDYFDDVQEMPSYWFENYIAWPSLTYQPSPGFSGYEEVAVTARVGNIETKPFRYRFYDTNDSYYSDPETYWHRRTVIPRNLFNVSGLSPSSFSNEVTNWKYSTVVTSLSLGTQASRGTVSIQPDGGFTYTPNAIADGEEPYVGWDLFSVMATDLAGIQYEDWIQLNVGDASQGNISVNPLPQGLFEDDESEMRGALRGAGAEIPPERDALVSGVAQANTLLGQILGGFKNLGNQVKAISNESDLDIFDSFDTTVTAVEPLLEKYNEYLSLLGSLNKAAGKFLAAQWYVSTADYNAVAAVNKLPFSIGSLRASDEQMTKLADSLEALGKGAAIAVDTASSIVTYAENTQRVLDAVVLASGVGGVVKTGAQILVKEGFKQLAKQAAKGLVTKVAEEAASQTANVIAGYLLSKLGIQADNEYLQAVKLGVDSYQAFSLLKKVKPKCKDGVSCFAAGTNVVVGINSDGTLVTKPIEQIREGDYVLSRDQYDADDDLDRRRVTQVFRKTSGHLRVLTVRNDSGETEILKTTDDHPFWIDGKGWVAASELSSGSILLQPDGRYLYVVSSVRELQSEVVEVFNFEVADDHTYFVTDDNSSSTIATWVHNLCVNGEFVARIKSRGITLPFGLKAEVQSFKKRTTIENQAFQTAAGPAKASFVTSVSADNKIAMIMSKDTGLSVTDVKGMMATGVLPPGWQVHHKRPTDWGGTNDPANFVIMKNADWHRAITAEQRILQNELGVKDGDSFKVAFPIFPERIFPS